jgi:hypothetical protein
MKTIPLTQGKYAIVDDEHYDYLNQWKWMADECRSGIFYAKRTVYWTLNGERKKRNVKMHREIAGISGFLVDHINHDTLDNRSCNLRVATYSQNKMNSIQRKKTPSGFKGVRKMGKKFQVRIQANGIPIAVGVFPTKEDAALAYNKAALSVFGNRACLNQITSEDF